MATHLNLRNLKKIDDKKDTKLHWMPCVIKSDGEAKVSEFFEPIISKREDGVLRASFRGYPLLGNVVDLPKNYTGVVLQQTNERLNGEAERDLYGVHLFDRFTYWNWDVEPSGNDRIISALDWLHVAEAIYKIRKFGARISGTGINSSLQVKIIKKSRMFSGSPFKHFLYSSVIYLLLL